MVCSVWQAWGRVAGGRCMNRYATLASPPCHRAGTRDGPTYSATLLLQHYFIQMRFLLRRER